MIKQVRTVTLCLLVLFMVKVGGAADWAQLQNGPQRQGYSSENIDEPVSTQSGDGAWKLGFSPERLHPQTQPVIAGGKVFIGTAMGNFYAFNSSNGQEAWYYPAGGEILHTAGVENGKVFFGCMDSCVYALDVTDGSLEWKFDSKTDGTLDDGSGFSTAVLLANSCVYIASRAGIYYAINQSNGSLAWEKDVGAPIQMSSAYNNGRIFVGAMDMRCYALDTSNNGNILWTSDVLWGSAFKDYWPVCCQGKVIIRPRRVQQRVGIDQDGLSQAYPMPQSDLDKQTSLIAHFTNNPEDMDMFVLDETTGQESLVVAHWSEPVMCGAVPPPCVDGDGKLIVHTKITGGWGGWGRMDLSTGKVTEVLYDGVDVDHPVGNHDETLIPSAAGRLVMILHVQEGNANDTGSWHLDRREWTAWSPFQADGYFYHNTQGGGTCAAAISGGRVFHTTVNTLNCRVATLP